MTTRTIMKAEMASLTKRTDLSTEIGEAIAYAIKAFQDEKIYIKEQVDATFTCVIDQTVYTVSDDADIPLMADIESLQITDDNQKYNVDQMAPAQMELLLDGDIESGRPEFYSFYGKKLKLWPAPSEAFVVNMIGPRDTAEPATDDEASNVWMVEAYHMVMHRALGWLYRFHIRDYDQADKNDMESFGRLEQMYTRTNRRKSDNKVVPTSF
jgi:hypothetical protein